MRTTTGIFAVVLLAGCAGGARQPVELSGPAPAPAAQTMSCVTREMDRMGFTVPNNSAQSTTVTGTRVNEPAWYLRLVGITPTADQLTASVTQGQLRVTAISSDPTEGGTTATGAAGGTLATEDAERAAQQLVRACGRG